MAESVHISVLLNESVAALCGSVEGGRYLDCTLGGAGHTQAILEAHPQNHVVACDRDTRAIARATVKLASFGDRITLRHAPFSTIADFESHSFDGVFADLGMSTDQLREGRGFSYSDEGALDMRMDEEQEVTAASLVNELSEQDLFVLLKRGGVGSDARRFAHSIVRARPITTPKQLAQALGGSRDKNPAPVVFQALRIAVNNEFEEIDALMAAAPRLVKEGGRLAVITFHSLEDKAVTRVMRAWEGSESYPAWWPGRKETVRLGKMVHRKPIVPSDAEVEKNPSARSARLRVFQFFTQA
jgi:16S rRNA (cytosine1402-N4)-methyltransferase